MTSWLVVRLIDMVKYLLYIYINIYIYIYIYEYVILEWDEVEIFCRDITSKLVKKKREIEAINNIFPAKTEKIYTVVMTTLQGKTTRIRKSRTFATQRVEGRSL